MVEVGVGLVPAGGGCLRTVERYTDGLRGIPGIDPLKFLGVGMLNIATAKVGTGAEETRKYRYLRPDDGMCLNRDHLIYEAKHKAIGMAEGAIVRLAHEHLKLPVSMRLRPWRCKLGV